MRILVTGAAGLVASHIADALYADGPEVGALARTAARFRARGNR